MGILAVICSVGLDLAGLGFRILVWFSNGGFGVWFGVSMVFQRWWWWWWWWCCCCLVGLVFLSGWFGGAGVSVSLVVEERDRDEEMGDKSIGFYSICFVVYIILLGYM